MTVVLDVLAGVMFASFGLLLMVGAQRRWKWLVDPPEELWPVYTQSLVKKLCGTDVLETYTYYCGLIFLAGSVIGTVALVWRAFNGGQ